MLKEYEYDQNEKNQIREETLKYIIGMLSDNRGQSACVRENYTRNLYNWITTQDYDIKSKEISNKISINYIDLWEDFHKSFVGIKRRSDLTVCYLSGPQPMNDFKVLVNNGIHPHNIWAFEVDKGTYKSALQSIDASDFPMLKLHKGSIEQFFLTTPKKFDIVYLDFCGAIPGSQHTTRIIASLFKYQRLNSPGALITNIAMPDITKEIEEDKYSDVISSYLSTKDYLEDENGKIIENKLKDPLVFKAKVKGNFELFYSQFITRQIMDIATITIPWSRLASSTLWSRYFNKSARDITIEKKRAKELSLSKSLENINMLKETSRNFGLKWIDELFGYPEPTSSSELINCYESLKSNSNHYTSNMIKIIDDFPYKDKMFQFCDKPSKNLVFDMLINQLSYPMHYNTRSIIRRQYQAKKTKMFTDCFIFDEARYIYEWLPTIDLINNAFDNIPQQLTYRFALDGLVKSRMYYNPEYFFSGSVVSVYDDDEFKAEVAGPRIQIGGEFDERDNFKA